MKPNPKKVSSPQIAMQNEGEKVLKLIAPQVCACNVRSGNMAVVFVCPCKCHSMTEQWPVSVLQLGRHAIQKMALQTLSCLASWPVKLLQFAGLCGAS